MTTQTIYNRFVNWLFVFQKNTRKTLCRYRLTTHLLICLMILKKTDAFSVKASGYLIKPVDKPDFDDAVLDCIHRLLPTKNPSIILKSKTGLHRIPVYKLVCIESFNHNQIVTLSDGSSLETSATLVELMEVLKDHPSFVRPHRAYIVNMDFIRKLSTRELLLTNGKRIPISQNRYKELKNSYFSYMIHS